MNLQPFDPHATETAGRDIDDRFTELAGQRWNRSQSAALAIAEGITFSDAHSALIVFMRKLYLEHGLPISARTTARALNKHFSDEGGSRYLRRLFSEGAGCTGQSSANLRTPPLAIDTLFGTSY